MTALESLPGHTGRESLSYRTDISASASVGDVVCFCIRLWLKVVPDSERALYYFASLTKQTLRSVIDHPGELFPGYPFSP